MDCCAGQTIRPAFVGGHFICGDFETIGPPFICGDLRTHLKRHTGEETQITIMISNALLLL